ncbi:hypothetical protein FRB99_001961 [Tulasnella sp. 403]|nr:hypothetical protein FRB99_001961 [Tulasnella sp. 403]
MMYANHNACMKAMQLANATISRQYHASESEVKALGGWNVGEGSYRACYERSVPVEAMLGVAYFNTKWPEDYQLACESLCAPDGLATQIFPWAEAELELLNNCALVDNLAQDLALQNFLLVLIYL